MVVLLLCLLRVEAPPPCVERREGMRERADSASPHGVDVSALVARRSDTGRRARCEVPAAKEV